MILIPTFFQVGIEFVKHFRAHLSPITQLAVNSSGTLLCTVSSDKAVKILDIVNFDMINILQLGFTPSRACWIVAEGNLVPEVALAEEGTNKIHVYDAKVCYLQG